MYGRHLQANVGQGSRNDDDEHKGLISFAMVLKKKTKKKHNQREKETKIPGEN